MKRSRLGLRREVLILLPAAIVLLTLLSGFTLLSFRNAVRFALEERRSEAARLAAVLAREAASRPPTSALDLLARAPQARALALLDRSGLPLLSSGDILVEPTMLADLLASGMVASGAEPVGFGPLPQAPELVSGLAQIPGGGPAAYLRVDLPALGLGGQSAALRPLGLLVVGVNAGVLLLVLFFVRHLLAPWEALIEKARKLEAGEPEDDEVALLLGTFERAIAAQAVAGKAPEEDIAALQRTLEPSLESGLLLLGRQGEVLALNAVGAALLGRDVPPLPGAALEDVLAGHDELLRLLRTAFAEAKGLHRQEVELSTAAGRRTLGLTVHPLRREDRSVRGSLVLFADLTEVRKRADEVRLEESLAQLGEMAAGVAHELRNGLATLRGWLTLVERDPEGRSSAEYLQEIRLETDHLQRVVSDFLLFARPGSARPAEISLVDVLRRAATDPALAGAAVELALPASAPRLVGDAQLLEHAIRNLLANATRAQRAAGAEGPVRLGWSATPDGVTVSIEDDGAGLPQMVRDRLFEPFVTTMPGGAGLGLAVAHRIVAQHGGRLRLENRAAGGARAEISFPADKFVTESSEPGQRPLAGEAGEPRGNVDESEI